MPSTILIDKREMALIMERLAAQVLERHPETDNLMLAGIQRRGADLALRLARLIEQKTGKALPLGTLDINLYRDDWTSLSKGMPHIGQSRMPISPDGKIILLVDDVLFTGRTIRAALEALLDYGRPDAVELLVFIDRGHRELPIRADYTGRKIGTEKSQHVDVFLEERDNMEGVYLS